MDEAKELLETYMRKHGRKIEDVLGEAFKAIVADGDGDSLYFFHLQLVGLAIEVQRVAGSRPVVREHDPSEYVNFN